MSLRILRISSSPSRTPSTQISSIALSPALMKNAACAFASSISSVARTTISLSAIHPLMSSLSHIAPSR